MNHFSIAKMPNVVQLYCIFKCESSSSELFSRINYYLISPENKLLVTALMASQTPQQQAAFCPHIYSMCITMHVLQIKVSNCPSADPSMRNAPDLHHICETCFYVQLQSAETHSGEVGALI